MQYIIALKFCYDVIFCLTLPCPLKFRNSLFLDGFDILLRGKILGADSESEVIFYIRSQHRADIGHFLQFCLRKSEKHSLIIGLLCQQLKS